MREKSPIESFTERPARLSHTDAQAFTVFPWRFFLCPDMQIYLDFYRVQRDRYHTLRIGGGTVNSWMEWIREIAYERIDQIERQLNTRPDLFPEFADAAGKLDAAMDETDNILMQS